jgi:2-polyprenyl-3-methyl-5-hydroxy-6-metoxy-1,4-benzoquinol methylase
VADVADHPYDYRERRSVLPFVPSSGRVLDVGCSLGGFGVALRDRNPDQPTVGIELDTRAVAQAQGRYHQVLVGAYPDDLDPTERFDCIVFNDVLEHLVDPWEVLRRSVDHLTPSGRVVASIPSIRFLPAVVRLVVLGQWTYTDAGTLDRTHLRFFTRKSMLDLFTSSGYEVDSVNPINPWRDQQWLRTLLPDDMACMQLVVVGHPRTEPTDIH